MWISKVYICVCLWAICVCVGVTWYVMKVFAVFRSLIPNTVALSNVQ